MSTAIFTPGVNVATVHILVLVGYFSRTIFRLVLESYKQKN